jgi:hypothetical protein
LFLETDIIKMLKLFIKNFHQTVGISICFSSLRIVPLLIWGRPHTGGSQEKRKESFNLTIKYMMSIFPF